MAGRRAVHQRRRRVQRRAKAIAEQERAGWSSAFQRRRSRQCSGQCRRRARIRLQATSSTSAWIPPTDWHQVGGKRGLKCWRHSLEPAWSAKRRFGCPGGWLRGSVGGQRLRQDADSAARGLRQPLLQRSSGPQRASACMHCELRAGRRARMRRRRRGGVQLR